MSDLFLPESRARKRHSFGQESSSTRSISRSHSVSSTTCGSESETRNDIFPSDTQVLRDERYRDGRLTGVCGIHYGESKTGNNMATPSGQQEHPSDDIQEDNVNGSIPELSSLFHRESGNINPKPCNLVTPAQLPSSSGMSACSEISNRPLNAHTHMFLPDEHQLPSVYPFNGMTNTLQTETIPLIHPPYNPYFNKDNSYVTPCISFQQGAKRQTHTDQRIHPDHFDEQTMLKESASCTRFHHSGTTLDNTQRQDNRQLAGDTVSQIDNLPQEIEGTCHDFEQTRVYGSGSGQTDYHCHQPTGATDNGRPTQGLSNHQAPKYQGGQGRCNHTSSKKTNAIGTKLEGRLQSLENLLKKSLCEKDKQWGQFIEIIQNQQFELSCIKEDQSVAKSERMTLENKLSDAEKTIQMLRTNQTEAKHDVQPEGSQCYRQQQTDPTTNLPHELPPHTHSDQNSQLEKRNLALQMENLQLRMESLENTAVREETPVHLQLNFSSNPYDPNMTYRQSAPVPICPIFPPSWNYPPSASHPVSQIPHYQPNLPSALPYYPMIPNPNSVQCPNCQPAIFQSGSTTNSRHVGRKRNNKRGTPRQQTDAQSNV